MLRQMLPSATVAAFGLAGAANAQEPAKQTQNQQYAQKRVLPVAGGDTAPVFAANFDRAARTTLPPPLAPGSAEIP